MIVENQNTESLIDATHEMPREIYATRHEINDTFQYGTWYSRPDLISFPHFRYVRAEAQSLDFTTDEISAANTLVSEIAGEWRNGLAAGQILIGLCRSALKADK